MDWMVLIVFLDPKQDWDPRPGILLPHLVTSCVKIGWGSQLSVHYLLMTQFHILSMWYKHAWSVFKYINGTFVVCWGQVSKLQPLRCLAIHINQMLVPIGGHWSVGSDSMRAILSSRLLSRTPWFGEVHAVWVRWGFVVHDVSCHPRWRIVWFQLGLGRPDLPLVTVLPSMSGHWNESYR